MFGEMGEDFSKSPKGEAQETPLSTFNEIFFAK